MKRTLLIAAVLFGFIVNAQVTAGSVTMGAGYANQVYYKLATATATPFSHASWDLAFLRTSNFGFATRVNEAKGIEAYEASANLADWATIDVANAATWNRLYNSETEWELGAIDQGSAGSGWGEYNPANHHVIGTVIFVLKYADGTFRKFRIDDFYAGYTFTYATWASGTWSADTTVTLPNATNPTTRFNYYSLENNAPVLAEPAIADWDLTFTKYNTDYYGDGKVYQPVTGVLHNANLLVAENLEPGNVPDISNLTFTEAINTMGYDWKKIGSDFTYTVNTDKAYYVKHKNPNNSPNIDPTIYRLVFASFAGSSTGDITFNYEDVTDQFLGTEDFNHNTSFAVFPNPAQDKKINVVYDMKSGSNNNNVSVYNITGALVYEKQLSNASGFFNQEIDLGSLNNGVYVLKFQSGGYTTTQKIVLQ